MNTLLIENNKHHGNEWLGHLNLRKNLAELVGDLLDDVSRELIPAHLRIVDPVIAALPDSSSYAHAEYTTVPLKFALHIELSALTIL